MDKKALTLSEIHEGTLIIVKKIISICEEIDINYFVIYGTLLGTIRHKGFIPWDDDFDIMLFRQDYDKFEEYCLKHEEQLYPFKLVGRKNTVGYPFTINRFCDLRYKMESDTYPDVGMGIFVDIYPFDGIGNDIEQIKKEFKYRFKFLSKGAVFSSIKKFPRSEKGLLVNIANHIFYLFAKCIGPNFFLNRLENLKLRHSITESKYVSCITWSSTKLLIFDKNLFKEYILIDFEDLKVKVPIGYDKILKILYDDYKKLPPENKRTPRHEYKIYKKI